MKILVTGGAGCIGCHVVKALSTQGNLSTHNRKAIPAGELVMGDLADVSHLEQTVQEFRPDTVMHFAAFICISESVQQPLAEVIDMAKHVTCVDFPVAPAPRREGDPAGLVADSGKIRHTLGWKPRYNDLEHIVRTPWEWEKGGMFGS